MAGRFSIDAVFKGIDGITGTIRRISGRLRELGDSDTFKKLNGTADRILGTLGRVAGGVLAVSTAMAGFGANVVTTGMEFEATLMGAVARFPGEIRRGTEAFDRLQMAAENLGATTEFDAQQAAGALQTYAAAGFNATLAIASLDGAGNLATVSGLALDEAAKTAADSLGALGLQTENAAQQATNLARLNDVLARTTGLANTSVTELSEAIKVGGAVTTASGQSFETFAALTAALARSSIKGAEAGTAVRNMFLSLQAPSATAARAIRGLHVNVADSHGNMRDMADVMGDVFEATSRLGGVARQDALKHIFGEAAMPAVLALMRTGAEGIRGFRTELEHSSGAASRMAATMRDTTKNEIDGFTSAIDGVKTALFGVISGPFRQFLGQLTEWIGSNTQLLAGGVREWMSGFAANLDLVKRRAQGLAVLVTGLAAAALGIKAVAAATAIWNALAAANPWLLAIMAIVVAVAALVAYRDEVEAFFNRFTILRNIVTFVGRLAIGLGVLTLAFKGVALATTLWNAALALNPAILIIMGIVAAIIALDYYWPQISAGFTQWWNDCAEALAYIGDAISGAFDRWWNDCAEALAYMGTSITSWFTSLGARITGVFDAAWNAMIMGATGIFGQVVGVFAPLVSWFTALWQQIATSFGSVVGPVIDTAMRIAGALGMGGGEAGGGAPQSEPQVVSPQQRTAQAVNSTSTNTTTAEVRVRADPGTDARVTRQPARGTPVRVMRSAA